MSNLGRRSGEHVTCSDVTSRGLGLEADFKLLFINFILKGKRQLETKSFETGPVFTAGYRRSELAPLTLNRALRYVSVHPLKQLFVSLTGSGCTNKSQYIENILF